MNIDTKSGVKKRKSGGGISLSKRILLTSHEYACHTTIQGIYYIFESRRGIDQFLWFLVVVAALMFSIFQTSNLYRDWQNEPVITTLDTIAMPIEDIKFPAVTICPQGTITSALDAVLFKQLKEYVTNKTLGTSKKTKRSAPMNDDMNITEDLLREFLRETYPGAKKKPTKIVKVMLSNDPELTLENEAIVLPGLDDEECGNISVDDYIQGMQEMNKSTCPDGFSLFKDLFCFKTASVPMDYKEATEYCNSQSGSSMPFLESKIDLHPFQDLLTSLESDTDDKVEAETEENSMNNDCPENHVHFGGHCYIPSFLDKASRKTIYKDDDCFDNHDDNRCNWNWSEAKEKCRSYSTNNWKYDLISIQSQEEYDLVVNGPNGNDWDSDIYSQWKQSFAIWIGLNDADTEGQFKWSDGQGLSFTKWAESEPNGLGNEDCVALEINLNGWNDRPCSDPLTFVCEGVPNGNRKKEYYAGDFGGFCHDTTHVIRSQIECMDALQKLGYQTNGTYHWKGSNTGLGKWPVPSGCSIQKTLKPYFETSRSGLGASRTDQKPICRRTARTAYKTVSENEKKKCTSTALLSENRLNIEDCIYLCDQYENCKFIFWNTGLFCSLHETCDDFKTPRGTGHILAKESGSVTDYWVHGKASLMAGLDLGAVSNQLQADDTFCLTIKNTADNSDPIVVKSENCSLKRHVICKLEPHIAPENAGPALPPKFPCISSDQDATLKNKREVGTDTIHRRVPSKSEVSKGLIKDIKFENDEKTKESTKEYYAVGFGELCNDTTHVIRSQTECTDALQKLGYQSNVTYWSGFNTGLGKWPVPSGCSIQMNTLKPHLEKSPTGLGASRNDQKPICRLTARTEMCTGDFQDSDLKDAGNGLPRPPAGTKCTSNCIKDSGRWGSSYCYTDNEEIQWGAECVECGSQTAQEEDNANADRPENIKTLEVSIDPTKFEERLMKRRAAVQDYEENFGSLDFLKSYSSMFELLWYGQLPCTDVRGITSEIKNEMAFIKRCYWKGKKLSCNSIFRKQPTEQGMCCSFNMKKAEEMLRYSRYKESVAFRQSEETQMSFEPDEQPEWYTNQDEPRPEAGVKKGLTVVFDGHSDKLSMGSVSNDILGFKVVVDDSQMFPLVSRTNLLARPGHQNNINVNAMHLEANDEIRKYAPDRRHCYFPDEFKLQMHTFYSQPNCIFECETQFASKCLATCNEVGQDCDCSKTSNFMDISINSSDICIPWFYPASDEKVQKFCNPWNVRKFQEIMDNQIPREQCGYCLPDCNTTKYQTDIVYSNLRKCDVNNIGGTSILCDLVNDPLNPAPWSNTAITEYQESNETVPWFLKTFQADRTTNASKFSNFRYLGKGLESNALFGSDIKANPTYDAFERDIGIMNVFFKDKMILKYTKKNKMSIFEFISQLGGSVGLAMGMSLISVVELIYWMTFRLFGRQEY